MRKPSLSRISFRIRSAILACRGQGNGVQEFQGVHHRHGGEVVDADAPHRHRQGLRLQPLAAAGGTGAVPHVLLDLLAHGFRLGLVVPALEIVHHALKGLMQHPLAPLLLVVELQGLPLGTKEDHLPGLLLQVLPGGVQLKVVLLG